MKKLATLYEKDIYPKKQVHEGTEYADRITGKAIIFDKENKIALVGNKQNEFLLLPGGGIRNDEDTKTGTIRECLEETGCAVNILIEVGCVDDYRPRDKKHCISYGYVAQVIGSKGYPSYTKNETEIGMYTKWVTFKEALDVFKKQKLELESGRVTFYNTGFNIVRDFLFLEEIKKLKQAL
ncbi:MAG: NUDIX domain-containing protein [Minisyncoccota bacterium]